MIDGRRTQIKVLGGASLPLKYWLSNFEHGVALIQFPIKNYNIFKPRVNRVFISDCHMRVYFRGDRYTEPEEAVQQTLELSAICDTMAVMWSHCSVIVLPSSFILVFSRQRHKPYTANHTVDLNLTNGWCLFCQ